MRVKVMSRQPSFLWFLAAALPVFADSPPVNTSTALLAAPSSITLSQTVTLTATITPPPPAGKVTFYDGSLILGVAAIAAGGTATFSTAFLAPGKRSLQARFWGQANFSASASTVVQVTVTPLPGVNFTAGEFSPFTTGAYPQLPAVGDFNGDGNLDLAILSQQGLNIWLGDGNGGFTQRQAPQTPLESSITGIIMSVGDFNGDGNLDLAVPDDANAGSVTILLGDGQGGFSPSTGSPFAAGDYPFQAAVADFNLDGKPDLAITNNLSSGGVTILLGDGAGGFTPANPNVPVPIAAGENSAGIAVGDFNGDGKPDLAVADLEGTVTILLGDGSGGFSPAPNSPVAVGVNPYLVVVGDFNQDGKLDLATANYGSGDVSVLFGDGTGGFVSATGGPFPVGDSPITLSVGDFNGDGLPDLAVAIFGDSSVAVLLGDGTGGFSPASYSPLGVGTVPSVVAGDFNGDGVMDLIAANYAESGVSVLLGTTALTIAVSQGTGFTVNQNGIYTFTVTNIGTSASSGAVTVTDTLPAGLTPRTVLAVGWNCSISGQTLNCTREDPLPSQQSYPEIELLLQVGPLACPQVPNVAVLARGSRSVASALTPISGCLNLTQQPSPLIVGQAGVYIMALEAVPGATINGSLNVTIVMPAGLTPTPASEDAFWACQTLQNVVCSSTASSPPQGGYPPLVITFSITPGACPTATDVVQVQLNGSSASVQEFSNNVSGCLMLQPSRLDFPNGASGTTSSMTVVVTSTSLGQQIVLPMIVPSSSLPASSPPAFSVATNCNGTIGFNDTCQLAVTSSYPCFGAVSASLWILTNDGATYTIPLTATGLPDSISLALNGTTVPASFTINPDQTYAASLTLRPSPNAACTQTAGLGPLSFSPLAPDNSTWDASLSGNMLKTGTVAGVITLAAQIGGTNITALDGSGAFALQIPDQAGVVESVAIGNQTDSSFEITVSGYSTPHNGYSASTKSDSDTATQVCFSFTPAAGSALHTPSQWCALQQDIEIWYERSVSYLTGSQFQGAVTVSFSGAAKAIGQVEVWIVNEMGMSAPSCLDFQSGASVSCQ